jgi:RNA polymerase sigma-70 factor, ECF subfamily
MVFVTGTPDPAELSDAEFMRQLASGRMSGLDALVRRHQHRVQALAYRLCSDRQAAEDLAQEAFLRVFRAARRYEPKAAFSTWLHTIVVHLYFDWLKRRRPTVQLMAESRTSDGCEVGGRLLGQERDEAVRQEIAALPERQRVALVLHCYEDLSHAEIAGVTGWSQSAVESLLVRAYKNLRDKLRIWGDFR